MCSHLEGLGLKGLPLQSRLSFFPPARTLVWTEHMELLSMPSYDDEYQVSAKRPLRLKAEVVNALALKSVGISEYAEYMTNALLLTT